MMGIIRPLPIATVYDASIEALCLDSPDQCVELIITALVRDGLTLLQMSQQLEDRFPSLLGMTDNARRCEMLNILVAAAHYPGDHALDIIEAAYSGLSTADNVRQEFRSRMDGFMPRIDQLTSGWGSLEDACLGFRRLSILDVPTQPEWVKKYESTLGNIERDLGLCIDHDDTERFILLMNNCGKRKPHRSALVNLFYTRDDTLAPNTRTLYLGQSEPQAEEVFARILAPINSLNYAGSYQQFLPPSSAPSDFVERHADLLWYTIAQAMGDSKTIQRAETRTAPAPASAASIEQASLAIAYLLKQGACPFAGLWAAQIEGYNVASIDTLKASVDFASGIKHVFSSLARKVHYMAEDGTLFPALVGDAKSFAMIKAIGEHFGPEWLAPIVTRDSQRGLLYRVTGDKRFLNHLVSEVARSNLLESDMGL